MDGSTPFGHFSTTLLFPFNAIVCQANMALNENLATELSILQNCCYMEGELELDPTSLICNSVRICDASSLACKRVSSKYHRRIDEQTERHGSVDLYWHSLKFEYLPGFHTTISQTNRLHCIHDIRQNFPLIGESWCFFLVGQIYNSKYS